MHVKRMLIVEDESATARRIGEVVASHGYDVVSVDNGPAFLDQYQRLTPDLVLIDLLMPDVDGLDLLHSLAERKCAAGVVLVCRIDEKVLGAARRVGERLGLRILGGLTEPMNRDEVEQLVADLLPLALPVTAQELANAIGDGEIVVQYQPKATLRRDRVWSIDGVEALARWNHPRFGLLLPEEFIPLAERTGQIGRLTLHVVNTVAAQVAAWRQEGLRLEAAINLPSPLLTDLELPDRIVEILRMHSIGPRELLFEMAESGIMSDVDRTMEVLTRFRLKGIGISVDDFGTGFSSLVQLYRMPICEMKVDRSFVAEIGRSREAESIVRAIVALAHALGMTACAEGVESQEALDFLRMTGCEKAQGFFIGKPLPAEELARFVLAELALEDLRPPGELLGRPQAREIAMVMGR